MPELVFISYTKSDRAFVEALADGLAARRVPVWFAPRHIPPGDDWDDAIDKALGRADVFLVVLSPSSVKSPEVKSEIQSAVNRAQTVGGIRVVPLIRTQCEMPRRLLRFQWIDFTGDDVADPAALDRVAAEILTTIDTSQVSAAAPAPALPPPARRSRIIAAAAAIVALLVVGGGLAYRWSHQGPVDAVQRQPATAPVNGGSASPPPTSTTPQTTQTPAPTSTIAPPQPSQTLKPRPPETLAADAQPAPQNTTPATSPTTSVPSPEAMPAVGPSAVTTGLKVVDEPAAPSLLEQVTQLSLEDTRRMLSDVFCDRAVGERQDQVRTKAKRRVAALTESERSSLTKWLSPNGRKRYPC